MSVIATSGNGGHYLGVLPSGSTLGDGNHLKNPTFAQNNYPVWSSFNGPLASTSATWDATYTGQHNTLKRMAFWHHYSPLYNMGWATYVGNNFNKRVSFHHQQLPGGATTRTQSEPNGDFKLLGFGEDPNQPRVIKMYGADNMWTFNDQPTYPWPYRSNYNHGPRRGDTTQGEYNPNVGIMPRMVSNTTVSGRIPQLGTTTSLKRQSMNRTDCWCRHEWQQHVPVPSGATYVTFGAYVRVDPDDQMKPLNWAGIYIAEDDYVSSSTIRRVNYFGIKDSSNNMSLPSGGGALSGYSAGNNWNGLSSKFVSGRTVYFPFNPHVTVPYEHAMLDQDDFSEFTKVEYTMSLSTIQGARTTGKITFGMFFAENFSYLVASQSQPTGSVRFFNPFVKFG